jgi:hypothetical protein
MGIKLNATGIVQVAGVLDTIESGSIQAETRRAISRYGHADDAFQLIFATAQFVGKLLAREC